MQVGDIMTQDVESVAGDLTISEAAQYMRDANVGCLVVEAGGAVLGVITDRDLVIRCSAEGHDPCQCQVQHHMTSPAITIEPAADVLDAARLMMQHKTRRLPVTLCDQLIGLVSLSDIEQEAAGRPAI